MTVILAEILSCLVAAAAIGFVTAWLLRIVSERTAVARSEADWRRRSQDLEARLEGASVSLREQQERAAQLAERLATASASLQAREQEFARLESELARTRSSLATASADIAGQRDRIATADARLEEMRRVHAELALDIERLGVALAQRDPALLELAGARSADGNGAAAGPVPEVLERMRERVGTLFALPAEPRSAESQVADIEATLESLRADFERRSDSSLWLADRVAQMRPIAERLHERAAHLVDIQQEFTALRPSAIDARPERARNHERDGDDTAAVIQRELEGIQGLLAERRATLSQLEIDHAAAAADAGPTGKIIQLEREIARLARDVAERDERIAHSAARISEAEAHREQLARDAERLVVDRKGLSERLRERDDYIDALEIDLQSSARGQNAEIESLKRRIAELEALAAGPPTAESPAEPVIDAVPGGESPVATPPPAAAATSTDDLDTDTEAGARAAALAASTVSPPPAASGAIDAGGQADTGRAADAAREAPTPAATDGAFAERTALRDDLKHIKGIGPVIERTLNQIGVSTFKQIARWTPDEVAEVERHLAAFRSRVRRDNWIDGARQQHWKKYGEWP